MLGGNHIRTGAIIALTSVALFGCTVPVSFIQNTAQPAPQSVPATAPVVEEMQPPAPLAAPTPQALVEGPDLWRKIGDGLTLHLTPHHRPSEPLSHLPYGKRVIETASAHSEPYLHFIIAELDRRKLPYELALIPLIESNFDPAAGSRGGPSGLWQMIPATGQRFGLQQSGWYDGRLDVVASTQAALHYFEKLQGEFDGDWLLAIAAYNCGERTVAQALERNRNRGRPTDFWSLGLSGSTRSYVERLLNVAAVVAEPSAYGVRPALVRDRPYFDVAEVGANLPLSHIAAASGFAADQFRAINAGLLRQTTVAGATRVLVAPGRGEEVALALSSVADEVRRLPDVVAETSAPRAAPRPEHIVRAGESLASIAARARVSVRALRERNHLSSTHLRLGQVLRLPVSDESVAATTSNAGAPSIAPIAVRTATPAVHVVAQGDNLWDIARQYNVGAEALANTNNLTARTVLKLGQKLRLPGRTAPPEAPQSLVLAAADNTDDMGYRVRQGDSLWTISRRFNVSVDALKKWNRLPTSSAPLRPGQYLVIGGET